MFVSLLIGIGLFAFLLVTFGFILPHLVWSANPVFEKLNHLYWFLQNPFRGLNKDFNASGDIRKRALWLVRIFYILRILYLIVLWVVLTPLRIINSFYYNFALFYSLTIKDSVLNWMGYNLNTNLHLYGVKAFAYWVKRFFQELPDFFWKLFKMVFQGIAMFLLDCGIPALTLYHGTSKMAVEEITKNGQWIAGQGDFGGLGVYFGLNKFVAHHYGDNSHGRVLLVRVSIPLIRSLASIPEKIKVAPNRYEIFNYPMRGGQGKLISTYLNNKPSAITELWRNKTPKDVPKIKGWYELCVLSEERGKPRSYWRIRAIGELNETGHGLSRLHNGIQFWPYTIEDWTFLVLSIILNSALYKIFLIKLI